MNNKTHYDLLIERAKQRGLDKSKLDFYSESHHIVPRCVGGSDHESNLVLLSAREHFIAHLLLIRIYPENYKLVMAAKIMGGSCNYNSRQFEWVRKKAVKLQAKHHKGMKRSPETCKRISESTKGKAKPKPEGFGETLSKSLKGRKFSETHKSNLSNRVITDQWKKNLSKSQVGRKLTSERAELARNSLSNPESKAKHAESLRLAQLNKIECPYCSKKVAGSNYYRWHGDNCKMKR